MEAWWRQTAAAAERAALLQPPPLPARLLERQWCARALPQVQILKKLTRFTHTSIPFPCPPDNHPSRTNTVVFATSCS